MNEIFTNILDAASNAFRHLGNANIGTLLIVAGGIVLLAYLIFRR